MTHTNHKTNARRSGFTLVELLVTVALLLVIMSMFASAFQIATGTLHKHRGIAENDQRARAAVSMLDGDLTKRTYRQSDFYTNADLLYPLSLDPVYIDVNSPIDTTFYPNPANPDPTIYRANLLNRANQQGLGIVPLHPDYNVTTRDVDTTERGYFYISENDPDNDTDDVLQLTVNGLEFDLGNLDEIIYTGQAITLANTSYSPSPGEQDQPIWDDGIGFSIDPITQAATAYTAGNIGRSSSHYAEVSYFVRNGNLYRRELLIREPAVDPENDGQPSFDGGGDMIPNDYSGDFWKDLDFSATRLDPEQTGDPAGRVWFNSSTVSLDNSSAGSTHLSKYLALGNPQNRFGHDPSPRRNLGGIFSIVALQGRPKEYFDSGDADSFFGRYTHEETSHTDFEHPGVASNGSSGPSTVVTPFSPLLAIPDTTPQDGIADEFADGPRKGEDLLLTNVHAFDIEVWDAAIQQWVDLGHNLNDGDWHQQQIIDTSNLPTSSDPVFFNTPAGSTPPAYASAGRAMYRYGSLDETLADDPANPIFNRIFDTWHPGFDFDPNDPLTLDDLPPFRPQWTDRTNFTDESGGGDPKIWEPSHAYGVGERVFPYAPIRNDNNPPGLGVEDDFYPGHQSLFYEAVIAGTSGASPPGWPTVASTISSFTDGSVEWIAVNNTIGLQAMRITIRFLDPSSQQMRQVSLVHSFIER
ncbi:MAG: prepilin-type N-terminal cleavage/methylation domain-containing protein [Planctomycetaceae bacterium]|nr:prepilin-type N-terminal cleavage/methylation domain-containing protein [Planctomycetaceae bacterium]